MRQTIHSIELVDNQIMGWEFYPSMIPLIAANGGCYRMVSFLIEEL